ncbi:MAG: hypothetical protein AABZ47_05565 [Planctomycetota bacterium]
MAKSLVKRVYDGLALVAVLNVLTLGGIIGYAIYGGWIDKGKVTQIGAVIRGEKPDASNSEDAASSTSTKKESIKGKKAMVPSDDPLADLQVLHLEEERAKVELEQQLALVQSMMLKVTSEREALRQERKVVQKPKEEVVKSQHQEGMKRQLEIYEGLAPKVALDHLLAMEDPDEAARVLAGLDPRKAKKILESAKTPQQMRQMQAVLARVAAVAPDRTVALNDSQP